MQHSFRKSHIIDLLQPVSSGVFIHSMLSLAYTLRQLGFLVLSAIISDMHPTLWSHQLDISY